MQWKPNHKLILIGLALLLNSCKAEAQDYKDVQTKELTFGSGKKIFLIENIFGSVTIGGTEGNKGSMEITESIKADSKADYDKAKSELKLKIENAGDTVRVYFEAPYINNRWNKGYKKSGNCKWDINYKFHYDFVVKIPKDAEVYASTVNDGEISVTGIFAKMEINNINGGIELKNVRGQTNASTINGKIKIDYLKVPDEDCKFNTINGDIQIYCDKNLSADVDYKSMNGEFYTNFDIKALDPEVTRETKKIDQSTFYKLEQKPKFRIGTGKIKMSFETLNGNMTIKYKE
ncbi:MAG: DUF4097 family beta strand repeat-containing protein [Bacteroidales bacterium]